MSVINPQRAPWYSKLQHAGVVFLRDFVALTAGLTVSLNGHYGRDVLAAAIGAGFAALGDLVAHRP